MKLAADEMAELEPPKTWSGLWVTMLRCLFGLWESDGCLFLSAYEPQSLKRELLSGNTEHLDIILSSSSALLFLHYFFFVISLLPLFSLVWLERVLPGRLLCSPITRERGRRKQQNKDTRYGH